MNPTAQRLQMLVALKGTIHRKDYYPERDALMVALAEQGYNVKQIARLAGIDPKTAYKIVPVTIPREKVHW